MLKSFVEHKIIAIFVALKSAGGSPRRSINTLKGLYVACTFVVQAITFLNTSGPTTTKRADHHNHTSGPTTTTQTGPSPFPSPVGRGVITEIPLSACCSLLTVLFAVVSHAVLRTLLPYLYILKAQLSIFILSSFVILSFCLNTLKKLLNFFFLSLYVFMSFCL